MVALVPPLAIGSVPVISAVLISIASHEVVVPLVLRYFPEFPVWDGVYVAANAADAAALVSAVSALVSAVSAAT